MLTVHFLFVCAADRTAETFDGAVAAGKAAGFSFSVTDAAGVHVASWCPLSGIRRMRRA